MAKTARGVSEAAQFLSARLQSLGKNVDDLEAICITALPPSSAQAILDGKLQIPPYLAIPIAELIGEDPEAWMIRLLNEYVPDA